MPVQTFATPASLYAEQVADLSAGGTGYFGAEVVVGGITWKWSGKYYAEAAPGSPSAPFTTEAERTAWTTANLATLLPGRTTAWGPGNVEYVWNGPLATDWKGIRGPYLGSAENPFPDTAALPASGPYVGHEVYLSNPLAPTGTTRFFWNGTVYRIAPNQTLACYKNADGSPLLDLTATSLVPGVTSEVWAATNALPDWMVADGLSFESHAVFGVSDTSSTALFFAGFSIRSTPWTGADAYEAMHGIPAIAAATTIRGSVQAFSQFQINGGNILGASGGTIEKQISIRRPLGDTAAGRKPRLSLRPGATTNRIFFYSFSFKSGAC